MTKTTGKHALVEILRREGVEYVFGIPGATEIQFMDALEEAPDIQYILGLQEIVCAGMAEGYARATGRPGVLNLHTAPGIKRQGASCAKRCVGPRDGPLTVEGIVLRVQTGPGAVVEIQDHGIQGPQ